MQNDSELEAEPVPLTQKAFQGREKGQKGRKRQEPAGYSMLVRLTCFKGLNDSEFKTEQLLSLIRPLKVALRPKKAKHCNPLAGQEFCKKELTSDLLRNVTRMFLTKNYLTSSAQNAISGKQFF